MKFSSPKPRFTWNVLEPDPEALRELERVIPELDTSLAREKERHVLEFTQAKRRAGRRAVTGLLAYVCLSAAGIGAFVSFQAYKISFIPIVMPIVFWLFGYYLVGRPWFEWIANKNRIRSLDLTRNGGEFLSWVEHERPPFVLYLRDFTSWTQPHLISGTLFSVDPVLREISWRLPEDVSLVALHNVRESVTKASNIIYVLSTDDTWERIVMSACAFAAMIVIAPRQSGTNLNRELELIRESKSLQRKTLLLYERDYDPVVQAMLPFVRWSAALWRPATGENLSGLGSLPDTLELVRYVAG